MSLGARRLASLLTDPSLGGEEVDVARRQRICLRTLPASGALGRLAQDYHATFPSPGVGPCPCGKRESLSGSPGRAGKTRGPSRNATGPSVCGVRTCAQCLD